MCDRYVRRLFRLNRDTGERELVRPVFKLANAVRNAPHRASASSPLTERAGSLVMCAHFSGREQAGRVRLTNPLIVDQLRRVGQGLSRIVPMPARVAGYITRRTIRFRLPVRQYRTRFGKRMQQRFGLLPLIQTVNTRQETPFLGRTNSPSLTSLALSGKSG
jgi:hypothetical protein